MRGRYFISNKEIKRKQLEARILKALDDDAPKEDVVCLLIMYLFTIILFLQASGSVLVHLFYYLDSFKQVGGYCWGIAAYEILLEYIPYCASWCRLIDRDGGYEEDEGGSNSSEEVGSDEEVDWSEIGSSEIDPKKRRVASQKKLLHASQDSVLDLLLGFMKKCR